MTKLPLTTSSKLVDVNVEGTALELCPYANAGITASEAPVLLSLESKVTVDADVFASRIPRSGGHGTASEARLIVNSSAAVIEDLVDEYGAVTVQTPFGTVQTFVTGTLENPQDQPDPKRNWLFLGVVIPEAWRRKFAQIETYVPADACPAALYRVRDKATNANGISGTDPFWLDGWRMSFGGEGEKLELLDAKTRDKLCDIAVDAETKGKTRFQCQLVPQTALAAGTYLVCLTTLAGGETSLWPVELKVELVEAVTPPEPEPIGKSSDGTLVIMSDRANGADWAFTGSGFQTWEAGQRGIPRICVAFGDVTGEFDEFEVSADGTELVIASSEQVKAVTDQLEGPADGTAEISFVPGVGQSTETITVPIHYEPAV